MNETAQLVRELRRSCGHTLRELARRSKTSAAALVDYEAGRHEAKLSTLRRLANAAGCDLVVELRPRLSAPEARSLALHRAIAEHLERDAQRVREIAIHNLQVMSAAHTAGHSGAYLDAWDDLLVSGGEELAKMLVSTDQVARDLRQASPFSGVLSEEERLCVLRGSPTGA